MFHRLLFLHCHNINIYFYSVKITQLWRHFKKCMTYVKFCKTMFKNLTDTKMFKIWNMKLRSFTLETEIVKEHPYSTSKYSVSSIYPWNKNNLFSLSENIQKYYYMRSMNRFLSFYDREESNFEGTYLRNSVYLKINKLVSIIINPMYWIFFLQILNLISVESM